MEKKRVRKIRENSLADFMLALVQRETNNARAVYNQEKGKDYHKEVVSAKLVELLENRERMTRILTELMDDERYEPVYKALLEKHPDINLMVEEFKKLHSQWKQLRK